MSSTKAILPIILCGKSSTVSNAVTKAVQPQINVTHTFRTLESAKEEIPNVLKMKGESRPLAVVLGGAFDEQAFSEIRDSVLKSGEKTTWLRKDDHQKATISPSESQSGYGDEIGKRVKDVLLKLASDQSLFHPSNEVKVY